MLAIDQAGSPAARDEGKVHVRAAAIRGAAAIVDDPVLGDAQVVVTAQDEFPVPGKTTLTSEGRSGDARREMEAEILKP